MSKNYLQDGTHVEVNSVDFWVTGGGTEITEPKLTDDSTIKSWDKDREIWREVRWDFSQKPAKLYYFDD